LVQRRCDVIFATTTPSVRAAKAATTTIPIVFAMAGDPVKLGFVGSLSRPGGNITGVALLVSELVPKRLEVLHEMVPSAAVIGFLAIRTIRIHRLTSKTFRHRPIYFDETCGSSMPQQSIRRLRWFYMLEESLKAFLPTPEGPNFSFDL